jgi:Protein of unknown function (DUF3108)
MQVQVCFAFAVARAALLAGAGLMFAQTAAAEPAQAWPIQVDATYKLSFTGFGEVGRINFQSNVNGQDYTSTGSAEIKVPLIYTWTSKLNGSGKLVADDPKPLAYLFSSQGKPIIGKTKDMSVRMGFKDNTITQVNVIPPHSPGGENYVPLRPEHMKDALDPLTAVMLLSRSKGGNPCDRKMPIFDGKQRFDLVMTAAGQQKVSEVRPSGQPAMGYLCKARYIPIAGYKNNDNTRSAVENTTIEVALRPVPSANLFVPYRVTVSTKWGTGTMSLQRMDIVAPGRNQIALVH